MPDVITNLINLIAVKLEALSPFAKAVVPAAATLVVALVLAALAGKFDTASLTTLGTGLVAAIVTYFVPNAKTPTPATVSATAAAPVVDPPAAPAAKADTPPAK